MEQARKTAVITGGTSGIGLECARLFLKRGWRTALIGRTAARGAAALKSLGAPPLDCVFLQGDIARVDECRRLAEEVALRFDSVDALVNSAGIYMERALTEMTEELYDQIMNVNCKGTYFMCREMTELLKKSSPGAIVNVSSDAGVNGNYLCTAYCASKGAVTVFTKALALELAPQGVRVNCVCPGDIDTPLTRAQFIDSARAEEARREMNALYPLGRIGTAAEVAEVVCFLASDRAAFVTGAAWGVDGGITAY